MKYFVNRQCYWGVEDPNVVEIAAGGCDYANADMLSDTGTEYAKLGSGQEYTDPREALEAAFRIRDAWEDQTECVRIEHGFTGGNTMPFMSFPDDEELRKWAQEAWDATPKCDRCGEPLPDNTWKLLAPYGYGDEFCSEYCADEAYYDYAASEEEDLDD